MTKEMKSKKYAGVFYRDLANGDRSYFLRLRIGGKIKRFAIGKKSEGVTEAFCNQEKIRIVNESKFGKGVAADLQRLSKVLPSFVDMVDFYIQTSQCAEGTKKQVLYLKNEPIAEIPNPTRYDIQQFLLKELSRIKPGTVNLKMKRIRGVYRHAIAHGFYNGEDPTFGMKPFKGEEARRRSLSHEEIVTLLEAFKKKPRHYLFLKIALCTGARSGSILRIHRHDIRDDGRVILFNEKTDQRQGLPICTYWQWTDKGAYTLPKEGPRRMACWKHSEDQRGPMMRTNLRNARRTAGFSQGRLAAKVGVTQQALSKHERATSAPGHFSTIRLYEKALNVPAEHLFPDIFNS